MYRSRILNAGEQMKSLTLNLLYEKDQGGSFS